MDRNEKLYFDDFSKKSLSEIQELFNNLKLIGLSDEEIEKYALEYKTFFMNKEPKEKCFNTSIPWRKELMQGKTIVSETDPVPKDLSQSVVSKPAS